MGRYLQKVLEDYLIEPFLTYETANGLLEKDLIVEADALLRLKKLIALVQYRGV